MAARRLVAGARVQIKSRPLTGDGQLVRRDGQGWWVAGRRGETWAADDDILLVPRGDDDGEAD